MANVLSPPPDPANLPAFRKWLRELYELLGRSTGTATLSVSGTASTITGSVSSGQVSGGSVTQTIPDYELEPTASLVLGAYQDSTLTWPTPFADANYSVSISTTAITGSPVVTVAPSGKTAAQVVLRMTNGAAGSISEAFVDVTGTHA